MFALPGHLHPRVKGQEAKGVRSPPEGQDEFLGYNSFWGPHASSHCLRNGPSLRSLGTMLWGLNIKNVANSHWTQTATQPVRSWECQLRFHCCGVSGSLQSEEISESTTQRPGGGRQRRKAVCVPVVPVWEEAAASPSIDSVFAEG